jgi:hypothetical protein
LPNPLFLSLNSSVDPNFLAYKLPLEELSSILLGTGEKASSILFGKGE